MVKRENHNMLESIKEAIEKDDYLYERVLDIIRSTRATSGQSMTDYVKNKENQDREVKKKKGKLLQG